MDITWMGHSSVRIKSTQLVMVTDPYDETIGSAMPNVKADVVSVSHDHPHHSYVKGVEGEPRVLSTPGEYSRTISGVRFMSSAMSDLVESVYVG